MKEKTKEKKRKWNGKRTQRPESYFLVFLHVPRGYIDPTALEQRSIMSQRRIDKYERRRKRGKKEKKRESTSCSQFINEVS